MFLDPNLNTSKVGRLIAKFPATGTPLSAASDSFSSPFLSLILFDHSLFLLALTSGSGTPAFHVIAGLKRKGGRTQGS